MGAIAFCLYVLSLAESLKDVKAAAIVLFVWELVWLMARIIGRDN